MPRKDEEKVPGPGRVRVRESERIPMPEEWGKGAVVRTKEGLVGRVESSSLIQARPGQPPYQLYSVRFPLPVTTWGDERQQVGERAELRGYELYRLDGPTVLGELSLAFQQFQETADEVAFAALVRSMIAYQRVRNPPLKETDG